MCGCVYACVYVQVCICMDVWVYVHVCGCMLMVCVDVCVHVYVCMHGGLVVDIGYLSCSPSYFLKLSLSLSLKLTNLIRLAGQ